MTRRALVAAIGAALAITPCAAADTIRLGRGIDGWRIGMPFRTAAGLVRSERHPENAGPGCTLGPRTASRIDYYPGLRLSWQNGRLSDVATTRAGDRSGNGFVIGRARLAAVRRVHHRAELSRRREPYALGRTSLTVFRRTGYETWKLFVYWFDGAGVLRALQTNVGGC